MFEQEAPKWPWELFNDADSNTIHVGSQEGLSYDSNTIKPPSDQKVWTAMIRIWSGAVPKGLRYDSNTIKPPMVIEAGYLCLSCALQQTLFGPFNLGSKPPSVL